MDGLALRCRLAVAVLGVAAIVALAAGSAGAADCPDRFPAGRFGIPPAHPALAGVAVAGSSPMYLTKQAVTITNPEDCQFLYTGDVFRLTDAPGDGRLLAGCLGDFNGDGRPDVALLMKRQRDGLVVPFVFQSGGARYHVVEMERIVDPDGFAEDATAWPGPTCIPRPPGGVFRSEVVGENVSVVGDLFTVGWKTYFWNPAAGRFDAIFTND